MYTQRFTHITSALLRDSELANQLVYFIRSYQCYHFGKKCFPVFIEKPMYYAGICFLLFRPKQKCPNYSLPKAVSTMKGNKIKVAPNFTTALIPLIFGSVLISPYPHECVTFSSFSVTHFWIRKFLVFWRSQTLEALKEIKFFNEWTILYLFCVIKGCSGCQLVNMVNRTYYTLYSYPRKFYSAMNPCPSN